MRGAGVLCFVALVVSVAETRPSTSEFVTTVISTETASSTDYAEGVTLTEDADVATSTDYAGLVTFIQHAALTASTNYVEKATFTTDFEAASSIHNGEGTPSILLAETTTDLITTEDSVVNNATEKEESEFTRHVVSTTISSTDGVDDIYVTETETTELSDTETASNIDRIISARNVAVTDSIEVTDNATEFNGVASYLLGLRDDEETSSTRYDVVGASTEYVDAPGRVVDVEGGSTQGSVAVDNNTEDINVLSADSIGLLHRSKHEPEPYIVDVPGRVVDVEGGSTQGSVAVDNNTEDINVLSADSIGLLHRSKHEQEPHINSSMILPCFMVNARRGITPFIARSYDFEAELESWTHKKLPTEIAFLNSDNSIHFVDLTERPTTTDSGLKVKEYGDKVSLYLYTRHSNSSGIKLSLDVRQILKAGFIPSHPTKVIAHGFWSNTNSTTVQLIKDAYLRVGYYNVIIVDWSPLVYGFYSSAREEANGVGDYLGQFLRFLVYEGLIDPRKLHLIGHSLGAHLVGLAGKRAHQDGWGVMRITGLDPALPYFTMSNHTGRLDRTDADIVDVIHTCVNFLGMTSSLGDIDFYPNEGTHFQPGCNLDVFGICSHGRAVDYFAESIIEPSGFVGKFCDFERTDSLVKADNCPGEPISVMGEWLEFHQPGRYVLRTAAKPPYGVGIDILYPAYLYKQARMLSG